MWALHCFGGNTARHDGRDKTSMRTRIGRRTILLTGAGVVGATLWPRSAPGQGVKTRLILLGTGGGPRPRTANSASAQVILVNDTPYVIDCGDGVARQLAFAGVPLDKLRHVFLTHHHSDHNADYGNLILLPQRSSRASSSARHRRRTRNAWRKRLESRRSYSRTLSRLTMQP